MSELDFALLKAVQEWSTAIRPVMAAFSSAGYGAIYLVVIAFLYWCVSPSQALRLSVLLLLSNCINTLLKVWIQAPRPYWVRPEVFTGSIDTASGMPSGHAQAATVFWGLMTSFRRRLLWWALCLLMIVGTSVSRVYFGVHFPSQILAGLAVGVALLIVFFLLEKPVCRFYLARSLTQQRLMLVAAWLFINGLAFAVQSVISESWSMPPEWMAHASAVHPGTTLAPLQVSTVVRDTSLLLGLLLGVGCLPSFSGSYLGLRNALWRFLPGCAVFAIFWVLSGAAARPLSMEASIGADALRGVLSGLWVSLWWPMLLRRFYKP